MRVIMIKRLSANQIPLLV